MQTWKRIEARYWPAEMAPVGCFFCSPERGRDIPHAHIERAQERAA